MEVALDPRLLGNERRIAASAGDEDDKTDDEIPF
jgi:hypothetical protein